MDRKLAAFAVLAPIALAPAADACDACAPDLDGCGLVGVNDVLIMLNNYGPCPTGCDGADLNGDEMVDGWDLGFLLGHWGPCSETLPLPEATEIELVVEEITDAATAKQGFREHDILVAFDDPDDELLNVFAATATCGSPSCFVQAPGVGGALPLPEGLWDALGLTYDSFVTIGVEFGPGNAFFDPNFPEADFIAGGPIGGNAGWAAAPPGQGLAGSYDDNRVRVARFTVEEGVTVEGALTVIYRNGEGVLFTGTSAFSTSTPCPWDVDGDTAVGFGDLIILLAAWGTDPGGPPDFDGGGVGLSDLITLLSAWGPCR